MSVSTSQSEPPAEKPKAGNKWMVAVAGVLACLIFYTVTWPLHYVAMVYWVYGKAGYHEQGIRVIKVKPITFSDGQAVPSLVDSITSLSSVVIAGLATTILVTWSYRIYVRIRTRN